MSDLDDLFPPRPKRETGDPITFRPSTALLERINELVAKTGYSRSEVIVILLEKALGLQAEQPPAHRRKR